jgi:hypothetical protein
MLRRQNSEINACYPSGGILSCLRSITKVVTINLRSGTKPAKYILQQSIVLTLTYVYFLIQQSRMFPLQPTLETFNSEVITEFLAVLYETATITICLSPIILHMFGASRSMGFPYLMAIIYLASHLYPKRYV